MSDTKDLVTITVDGIEVSVPKGTNLIEAAASVGVEIPYYCYHPHLSVAGNCRMCQVQLEGSPKLTIACNTGATQGMVVRTQRTSPEVKEAQRATLEFLLVNHPLDCTVCDQAGHCKLQDYYYEYNGKASRFQEAKVHKVKAEIFGPEVIYDGERCILCTRCVRFCEEVPKTSELGLFHRGDHAVIGVHPARELDNPLSGTVVDLCPVGALTHRRWRFNTRMWYTSQQDSVCPGCSTGCNVKVAERDGRIVQVKARLNAAVNKEWLCDEGRYGFERFQPEERLDGPMLKQGDEHVPTTWDEAFQAVARLKSPNAPLSSSSGMSSGNRDEAAVLLSPFLTVEELWVALRFATQVMGMTVSSEHIAIQYRERSLRPGQDILVSPDYAPTARAGELFGFCSGPNWRKQLAERYLNLLTVLKSGSIQRVLFVGDGALHSSDLNDELSSGIRSCALSVLLGTHRPHQRINGNGGYVTAQLEQLMHVLLPGRTVNEKNGVMINRDLRIQRLRGLLQPPFGSQPDWLILLRLSRALQKPLFGPEVTDERGLFRQMVGDVRGLSGLTLMKIGNLGVDLSQVVTDNRSRQGEEQTARDHG